ncbi:glutathione-disulfide reductase [Magnetospira sp. QH-2]|uniref:glutathione-disulfide reductase n=1 Tax=Magnetospira sp. (strain QH-2) TaxID=1288970 RepID=UPI0003E81930|nr:glutathione-disulfide reductase [Magnetospira sp. QH-2]CCQ73159.1 Glutathione reductase, chloroplastic [Magnetospira sp. QH-2]
MASYDYDLIVLGAGSGGVRAARLTAATGRRVALVEKGRVGGTCVLRGCVPKKLMFYASHFAEEFEDAKGFGWRFPGMPTMDWPAFMESKNAELDRLEGLYRRTQRENGVEIIEGLGRVAGAHRVEVDGKPFTAETILIAVGGRPSMPDIPGIGLAMTSDGALDLPELPKRMVIVGGGYIAVEFAGVFESLGVEVTIVIRAGNVLRGFDEDLRATLTGEMEKKGIHVRRECLVRSIEAEPDGSLSLRLAGGEEIATDKVLYATGRKPNTDKLGLAEAGIVLNENGAVIVDEYNRTSLEGVYAIGDVTDRVNLTPVAIREAVCFFQTRFCDNPMTMDYDHIPTAVFSQPPLGTVGLTEEEARQRGPVDIFVSRFKPMKYSLAGRDERVMFKLIVDRETQVLLGAHLLGHESPELIQVLGLAVKAGLKKSQLDEVVAVHPTSAEELVLMREPLPDPSPEETG